MQNIYKVHNYFKLIYINIILIMKSVNKSFDVNEVFSGVEKSFEKYNSVDSGSISKDAELHEALSVEVVSGLTDILKNVLSKPKFGKSEIANRFCEFVDMISNDCAL